MGVNQEQLYKVKLASGRVLGPIDLSRVRALILKNRITGHETAREHPQGEWKDINQIGAIAELLLAKGENKLSEGTQASDYRPILGGVNEGSTRILNPPAKALPGSEGAVALPSKIMSPPEKEEPTEVGALPGPLVYDPDQTRVENEFALPEKTRNFLPLTRRADPQEQKEIYSKKRVAEQATVVFDRGLKTKKPSSPLFRTVAILLVLVGVGLELLPDKNNSLE